MLLKKTLISSSILLLTFFLFSEVAGDTSDKEHSDDSKEMVNILLTVLCFIDVIGSTEPAHTKCSIYILVGLCSKYKPYAMDYGG